MNIEELREFCLSFKGATECMPFDEETLVFKVGNKMFLLTTLYPFETVLVKCNPEKAQELRLEYNAVVPAYHMNKRHWNGINLESDASDQLIKEWITDSYNLVVAGLSKKIKESL
ncbi:MAG: MmcQ/YjbR family DNA-binding protein [Marinifilaceae bacterium]